MKLILKSSILPYKLDQCYFKKEISRKRRKGHRRKSPQGGWGMGSKEPIPKMILFINGYSIKGLIYQKLLGPYTC